MPRSLHRYFLLKGLIGECINNEKSPVSPNDLASYVKVNVNTVSKSYGSKMIQTPVIRGIEGKQDLILFNYSP